MAKEGAEPKTVVKPVEIKEKDSLSGILEDVQPKFLGGHPAEEEFQPPEVEETEEERKERESREEEERQAAEKLAAKQTEKEEPPPEEVLEEEPPKKKYKNHEEAERAALEASRKMTEATTEAARLREQNEKLQAQFNDLVLKAVAKKDSEGEKPLTVQEKAILKGRIAPMLKKIEALDTGAEDYLDKVDALYEDHIGKGVSDILDTRLSTMKDEIKKEIREERTSETDQERANRLAIDRAKDAKLDMRSNIGTDPETKIPVNSADWDIFWGSVARCPSDGKTSEQIIDWAIKDALRIKKEIQGPVLSAREKSRKRQDENQILERVSVGKEAKPEEEKQVRPITLAEALESTHGQRRL